MANQELAGVRIELDPELTAGALLVVPELCGSQVERCAPSVRALGLHNAMTSSIASTRQHK